MAFLLGVMLAIFVVLSIDLILGLTGFGLVAALVVESAILLTIISMRQSRMNASFVRFAIAHPRRVLDVRITKVEPTRRSAWQRIHVDTEGRTAPLMIWGSKETLLDAIRLSGQQPTFS